MRVLETREQQDNPVPWDRHPRAPCDQAEGHHSHGTHHGEGHELEDAATAALLQAVHTLLHEPLDKLGVGAGCLGPQDGRDEQKEVCCGDREIPKARSGRAKPFT